MREIFGTPYVTPDSSLNHRDILKTEAKKLIPHLFAIQNPKIAPEDHDAIMRLLEILKFGKEFSPFVLRLEYEKEKLEKISVWKDPHYDTFENETTLFEGTRFENLNLHYISKDLGIIQRQLYALRFENHTNDTTHICIAGTTDAVLLVGREKASYFKPENLLRVFTPPLPHIHS